MSNQREIRNAIAAYGVWRAMLRGAVTTGSVELAPEQVALDTACEFGKWLHALPPAERTHPHFEKVRELHARFHEEAANVLRLVEAGRTAEAGRALERDSGFERVSRQLTRELIDWSRAA